MLKSTTFRFPFYCCLMMVIGLIISCNKKGKFEDEEPPVVTPPTLTIYEKMAGTYVGEWKHSKTVTTPSSPSSTTTTYSAGTINIYFNEDSTDLISSATQVGLSWFDDSTMVEDLVYYNTFNTNDGTNASFYYDADSLVWHTWNSHPSAGPATSSFFTGKKQ